MSIMLTLPLPNFSTLSTHPAAAPGTVAAIASSPGILPCSPGFKPSCLRTRSKLELFAARPEPLRACTFLVLALKKRQNMSPPIPVEDGSVMFRAAAAETDQWCRCIQADCRAYQLPQLRPD